MFFKIEALNTTVEESGFDRGLQPEKILGMLHIFTILIFALILTFDKYCSCCCFAVGVLPQRNRPLKFLIKWKNTDEKSFVTSEEACFMCAPMVFAYFEARLKFSSNGTFDNVIRERDSRIWFQSNYEPVEILGKSIIFRSFEINIQLIAFHVDF